MLGGVGILIVFREYREVVLDRIAFALFDKE